MKLYLIQFLEMGTFALDEVQFKHEDIAMRLKIFNALPSEIQGLAISWGFNDTVFREKAMEWVVENQFKLTLDEYYDKEMWKAKHDIDYEKLSNG